MEEHCEDYWNLRKKHLKIGVIPRKVEAHTVDHKSLHEKQPQFDLYKECVYLHYGRERSKMQYSIKKLVEVRFVD